MNEIIKILELNQLFNIKNAILYNFLSSLVTYIKKYYYKNIGNIIFYR